MLNIDRNKTYKVSDFDFVNYVELTKEEKFQILALRNREIVRKWMFSTEPINEEEHFNFIMRLENRDDAYYWVIKKDERIVACFNIINVDVQEHLCETGMFFTDTSLSGFQIILDTLFASYHLLFNEMNIYKVNAYTNVNNKFMLALNQFAGFDIKESLDGGFCHQYIDAELFQANQQKRNNIRDFLKLLRNLK